MAVDENMDWMQDVPGDGGVPHVGSAVGRMDKRVSKAVMSVHSPFCLI